MSSRTLLQLQDLWMHTWDHLRHNRRSTAMGERLYQCLQAFHENRLAGVLVARDEPRLSRGQVENFCDRSIEDLDLPEDALGWLGACGVQLAGELFQFPWDKLREMRETNAICQYLLALGFPPDFDPIAYGWRPHYFASIDVSEALSKPWTVVPTKRREDPWDPYPLQIGQSVYDHHHWIGTRMRAQRFDLVGVSALKTWQEQLVAAGLEEELHAAMYMPPDWREPEQYCPQWRAYKARIQRAQTFVLQMKRPKNLHDLPMSVGGWDELTLARRAAFVHELKREGMSPHFFDLVVFGEVFIQPGVTFSRRGAQLCVEPTIRDFLAQDAEGIRSDYWLQMRSCLYFWGLRFSMTDAELDEIFGPEQ